MAEENKANEDAAFVPYWLDQLDGYRQEFEDWEKRAQKICDRYRDERREKSDGTPTGGWRFNALWSNVQTLSPAVYKKAPKPVIERRYLDKDTIGRFASMTLERSLEVSIQECGYHAAIQKSVLDYLLVGRGVTWERYEPTYGTAEELGPTATDDEGQNTPKADRAAPDDDPDSEGEPTEAPRPVTWEKSYTDYVAWKNFRHTPAPVWEEVWWVAKREFLSRRELRTRFKGKDAQGKLIADLVPLQDQLSRKKDTDGKDLKRKGRATAAVWEIWDKTNREVVFIAPDYTEGPLERTSDPLSLQEFWPCQKPLYATTTNDTLVPVPDYVEYQDQAEELDNLTSRIKALTDAVRVNGVYDASYPALKRILQEGADNRLIAIANYAEFASKGGLEAAIDFIPLKDIVDALVRLYEARDRVKADMAEITGLSDIVRGQGQGSAKTATEQRIKGQFATLRLQDRQSEVARFCRDAIAIKGEIISEQFSPDILAEMTGMVAFIENEVKGDQEAQAQQAPPPGMGHNGGPPLVPQAAPPPSPEQIAQQIFAQAVDLLKNDKMRTFRIDIETDSTIEIDKQEAKEAATELVTAVGGLLEKSIPVIQASPDLVAPIGQTLLWVMRQFGSGRDVEGVWQQAIDKLSQKAKNPPPPQPSPEQIKAQAEMQKQQMENQRAQEDAQREREQAALEMQAAQQKQQLELQKMQADLQMQREEMNLMREKMGLELQSERQKIVLKGQAAQQQASIDADMMDREAQAGERKHELGMEVMEAKAKQAMKPKAEARA